MVGSAAIPALVGRDEELVLITEVLDAARRGRRAALCLRGEPGVGKSALLAYAGAIATDLTVCSTRGVPGVGELAFAGVSDIVAPLLSQVRLLPSSHESALRTALGFETGAVQPLAVAIALLNLLSSAASRQPVLVLVDDLPWVDQPSVDVLLFAARRLDADGVAFLIACPDEPLDGVDLTGIAEMPIVGVSAAAARALLDDDIAPRVVDEIHAVTDGNVLAMLELAASLDDAQRSGRRPIEGPIPVGPQLRLAFERRLRCLPAATQQALVIVAADWTGDASVVLDAIATSGLPDDALVPAELRGVIGFAERLEFGNALLRAVITDATAPPEWRAAHRALAEAFARIGDEERCVWHRAEACVGTDDEVAEKLAEIATEARRRGALSTAARAFERAARLTRDPDGQARLQFAAGEALWIGGRSERSVVLFAEALERAGDPQLRADIAVLHGQAEMWANGPSRAREFLVSEADRVHGLDASRATMLFAHAVTASLLACDIPGALAAGESARIAAAGVGGPVEIAAGVMLGIAKLHHGDADAVALLSPAAQLADGLPLRDIPDAVNLVVALSLADLFAERWDRSQRLVDAVIAYAREDGLVGLLPFALAIRADLRWRQGHWNEAALGIRNILELVEGSEKIAGALWAEGFLARVEAGMGWEAPCRAHAGRALDAGADLGMEAIVIFAESALGLLELGLGRSDIAYAHLQAVATRMRDGEAGEPGILWWAGDFIEAAWRTRRVSDAATVLRELEAHATVTGRTWAHAAAARGRGLLAGSATFADEFEHALAWHEQLDAPFEVARTKLTYAERLLEHGQRAAAMVHLDEATELCDRVGAQPWAARARVLAGRDDESLVALRTLLTERELEVAMIVGRGASNQQAAKDLFLSVKTIDFHLRNAYRKLGLQSRTQLAVALERQGLLSPSAP